MKILVIVSAYNEEKTIKDIVLNLKRNGYDVLVVDDGSTDKTGELAQGAGAILLRHLINLGQGGAIQTGFDFALKFKPEIVVTFDADGQHFVSEIPKLIQPIIEDRADVIIGSRFLKNQQIPFPRLVMNWVANLVTFILFGLWLSDSQSGFKAFRVSVLKKIKIRGQRFDWSSEVVSEIKTKKIKFLEVPIRVKYTPYSLSKGQNFFVGIKTFVRLLFKKIFS